MKNINVENLLTHNYKSIDTASSMNSALNKMDDSNDVLIAYENEDYKGIISHKMALRSSIKQKQSDIKGEVRTPPKITKKTSILEAARLMMETNLYHLPLIENGKVKGIVTADTILQQAKSHLNQKVEQVMTKNPVYLNSEDTLRHALVEFREQSISRLPVKEKGIVRGVISLHDVLNQKTLRPTESVSKFDLIKEKHDAFELPVSEIMNTELVMIKKDETIEKAIDEMMDKDVSSLLILENEKLYGIVTKKDFLEQISFKDEEKEETIQIQVSSKQEIKRENILNELIDFTEKNAKKLGPGYINAHITQHKETYKGEKLLHCRLRVRCIHQFDVTAQGYGEEAVTKEALRKLNTLMLKQNRQKNTASDVIDYTNVSAL